MFGIITRLNAEKIGLAKKIGLKRLLIMTEKLAKGCALIDHVKCGISLEVGPHKRKENVDEALELISNILKNEVGNNTLEMFEAFDIIKSKGNCEVYMENFKKVKRGELIANDETGKIYAKFNFYPVLVSAKSADNLLCLAARKLTTFKNNNSLKIT